MMSKEKNTKNTQSSQNPPKQQKIKELLKSAKELVSQNKPIQAIGILLKASEIDPQNSQIWSNLGVLHKQQGHYKKAAQYYNKGLSFNQNDSGLLSNAGNLLLKLNDIDQAFMLLQKAVKINPKSSIALNNLGSCYLRTGQYDLAMQHYKQAIRIDKNNIEAQFNISWCLLRLGEFQQGFTLYETRFIKENQKIILNNVSSPRWRGENISSDENKKLLICAEQGFGDTIQFIRFVSFLPQTTLILEKQIIIQVQKECLALIKKSYPKYTIISNQDKEPQDCAYHLPMLSLPFFIKLDPFNIPKQTHYLKNDQINDEKWLKNLQLNKHKTKIIGITWQGSNSNLSDYNRSLKLQQFMQIFTNIEVTLLPIVVTQELQQQIKQWDQAKEKEHKLNTIKHISQTIEDFNDTASIINACDIIVCVDTALAHLSGVLAKPTFVLIPFVHDWRWFRSINHSPWYPTLQLVRQSKLGDWSTPIKILNQHLKKILL